MKTFPMPSAPHREATGDRLAHAAKQVEDRIAREAAAAVKAADAQLVTSAVVAATVAAVTCAVKLWC